MRVSWILIFLIVTAGSVSGEDTASGLIQKRHWFLEVYTGGGTAVAGPIRHTSLWITGGRFGLELNDHLEYNTEVAPVFFIFQDPSSTYGFSFTPVLIKWNITRAGNLVPYMEVGAGVLFTSLDVPDGTSKINYTPQAGAGLQILLGENRGVRFSLRYMHLSNGGLASPNPGIETLQLLIGYQWLH